MYICVQRFPERLVCWLIQDYSSWFCLLDMRSTNHLSFRSNNEIVICVKVNGHVKHLTNRETIFGMLHLGGKLIEKWLILDLFMLLRVYRSEFSGKDEFWSKRYRFVYGRLDEMILLSNGFLNYWCNTNESQNKYSE